MKKKRKISTAFMILLILTLGLVITRGFSYARYASNAVFNYYLSSKGFYFESNDLSYDTKNNVDTMWDGDKVYFSVSNSSNGILASEVDIKYEVKCEVLEDDTTKKCKLNGTDKDLIEATLSANFGCTDSNYSDEATCVANDKEWVSKTASSLLYFEVYDSEKDILNANVKITVTSLKPYKKELSATYSLIKDNSSLGELSMKYEESTLKSNLIITNSYNEDKCVLVNWDAKDFVFDDKNNSYIGTNIDNDGNIIGSYFIVNKMDSIGLNFYKKDISANYNELYFKLVESNLCQ
jgi:hypothetical protein